MTTVKQLKEYIADMPDDAIVALRDPNFREPYDRPIELGSDIEKTAYWGKSYLLIEFPIVEPLD